MRGSLAAEAARCSGCEAAMGPVLSPLDWTMSCKRDARPAGGKAVLVRTERTLTQTIRRRASMVLRRVAAIVLAGVAGALALAACGRTTPGGTAASPSPRSEVLGLVVFSGYGGGEVGSASPMPEGFVVHADEGLATDVLAHVATSDGKMVTSARSDDRGLFRISLAPGQYVLWIDHWRRETEQRVIVQPGQTTRVVFRLEKPPNQF
jgi:hypothetical protein